MVVDINVKFYIVEVCAGDNALKQLKLGLSTSHCFMKFSTDEAAPDWRGRNG